ncbi:MAG: 50S ribosomal protein L24 [Candidatus Levybacteria bacterium]|nr:50S ribosomal protein L24 [Candidatus Levybacteria bacterium]
MKLKTGDTVQVIKGKDKGKSAKIAAVYTKENKVLLPEVNQYKRHVKSRTGGQKSEIKTIVKPLPAENVALVCPKCKQITRVGYMMESGEKVRVCKKCKQTL